jgi:Flp pilus assembly protein TadG
MLPYQASKRSGRAAEASVRRTQGGADRPASRCPTRLAPARGDDGFSALDMAIIFPVTLLIVFGIIQFGIWYHANDIARAAAQEAVRSASAYQATQIDGDEAANQVLTENANGLIIHTRVTCTRAPGVATATVTGDALKVIPFISLPVKASAAAPVEAFLPPPRA